MRAVLLARLSHNRCSCVSRCVSELLDLVLAAALTESRFAVMLSPPLSLASLVISTQPTLVSHACYVAADEKLDAKEARNDVAEKQSLYSRGCDSFRISHRRSFQGQDYVATRAIHSR